MFLKVFAVAILVPALLLVWRTTAARPGPFSRGLLYFVCIAIGFMVVEGVMVQRVSLFVGVPLVALAVVLCALLIGGGIGSWVSGRLAVSYIRGALFVIPVAVAGSAELVSLVFRHVAVASLWGRAMLVAGILIPVAFLMGMPFPSMLRQMREHVTQSSAALLYAINGAFSALAIMLVMFYAPFIGLSAFLYIAAALYVVAAILYAVEVRAR